MEEPRYQHVVRDASGVPYIAGTTMKVVELVLEQQAYGWSPKELHFQHPYLSLGQIYSALAYYWDHQGMLERDIKVRLAKVEALKRTVRSAPLQARLNARKST